MLPFRYYFIIAMGLIGVVLVIAGLIARRAWIREAGATFIWFGVLCGSYPGDMSHFSITDIAYLAMIFLIMGVHLTKTVLIFTKARYSKERNE